jgi:hypothetical protein
MTRAAALLLAALAALPATALAQAGRAADVVEGRAEARSEEKQSPWLVLPTFSVSPKLGAALGALVGYMLTEAEVVFGGPRYTSTTDSVIAAAFAQASFDGTASVVGMAAGQAGQGLTTTAIPAAFRSSAS